MQDLFELNVTEYREIKMCSTKLVLLKKFHDMCELVQKTFSDWKTTLWDKIDVDSLVDAAKALLKEVRGIDKQIKGFLGYERLESEVRNMMTSLPLVADLHHPAMRPRHWKQLMKATNKSFEVDEKFSLADLLALHLHEFVDDVAEIVDRAQKELIIEKQLKKIDETWQNMCIEFHPYEDADTHIVVVPEEVIEAMEENSMQLQNLSSQKYVTQNPQFFDDVTRWVRKLGNCDEVITVWLDVQKKWSNLQSIFVGSADIRIQLPEDSKRFDAVDVDWKDLMKEATFVPNVVEACNTDGRLDRLKRMHEMLEKCLSIEDKVPVQALLVASEYYQY